MKDEQEIDLPSDDDENVGDGVPKKKKEKRKKSREERSAERRVIFWTFFLVILVTFTFWIISTYKTGRFKMPELKIGTPGINLPKSEWKGYVEYKL